MIGHDYPDGQWVDESGTHEETCRGAADRCSGCGAGGIDLLAGVRSGAWLDQQVFAPLRYVVPGLIPEGGTLFCGPPKVGKSWFLLALALAAAGGGRVLGAIPVDQRPVFMLALEDSDRRMQDRGRKLLHGAPMPAAFHYVTVVKPGHALAIATAFMERHAGDEPLIILDTLGKSAPRSRQGESAYERDYRIGAEWKALSDAVPGSAVVVNHHTRKATSEDFVDSVSGTNGLSGAFDTVAVLARKRHETGGVLSTTSRDAEEGEYGVTLSGVGAWTLDGGTLPAAAEAAIRRRATSDVGDRMTSVIGACTPEGVRARDVAAKTGIPEPQVTTYLLRAAESGRLVKLARGLYGTPRVGASVVLGVLNSNNTHTTQHTDSYTRARGTCDRCGLVDVELVHGRCIPCAYPNHDHPGADDEALHVRRAS